jgi:hypothetical protein
VLGNYGYAQDWRVDQHPRFLAHLTNSGFADIGVAARSVQMEATSACGGGSRSVLVNMAVRFFVSPYNPMQFYPYNPLVRFAVGQGGAFYTIDGVNWTCLLHTGALTGRPAHCYFDWISDPYSPTLYVAFAEQA